MQVPEADVYILTEGGQKAGFGHVARCYALAQAFNAQGFKATLIVNGDDSVSRIIPEGEFITVDWLGQSEEFISAVNPEQAIFIIDSYLIGKKEFDFYASRCAKIAYLDDHARTDYPRGLILVPINFMNYLEIPYDLERDMLTGQKYILIRKPFWQAKSSREITEKIDNVLVMMGGMDVENLSLMALESVSEQLPESHITLIYNKPLEDIATWQERLGSRLQVKAGLSAEEMCGLMLEMDLAVITAGQAAYELLSLGVPTIQVSVAENQIWALHAIKDAGYTDTILDFNSPTFRDDLNSSVKLAEMPESRAMMRTVGQQEIDGGGAMRLSKDIASYFNAATNE